MHLTSKVPLGLVMAIGIMWSLASCDPTDDVGRRLGLWKEEGVVVEYLLCPDESVTRLELRRLTDNGPVLWEIEAPAGSSLQRFRLGVTPPGFVERSTLAAELQEGVRYVVELDSSRQVIASNTFTLEELNNHDVLTSFDDEYMSQEDFLTQGEASC